jgi:hypothetical protein
MTVNVREVEELVAEGVGERRLLCRPFYRRRRSGSLRDGELASYAEQYRHVEEVLPEVLASLVVCLLAFFGAPAAASLATRGWWWSTITLPVPGAYLGYLLATGPAVASVYREAAFLVAISVVDMVVVALVIASKGHRATHRAP